ncbi:MAG: long-chain fatty acid--CoA ligase [Acidobacteriota bacterium]
MSLNLATIIREGSRLHPEAIALIAADIRMSYKELDERARRFAAGLARSGVRRGQHVAVMLPNIVQFPVAYFGAHYLGAPVVPLNVLLKSDEVAYHLGDSDAVALVAWEGCLEEAREGFERSDECRCLIVAGDAADGRYPRGAIAMDSLIRDAAPVTELAHTMPDDTAVVLYTSGTTGRPKGAELTHFNLFYNADVVSSHLMPFDERTVALGALPLFHSFGQTVIQNAVLKRGGRIVLVERFDPETAFEAMRRHGVTFFAGVPTMYFALLHQEGASRHDLSNLKYCNSGGAAMPVNVMKAFNARYNLSILEGYGLSETSPVASFNRLDRPIKPGSIGLPIEGVEFRLADDEDRTIEASGVSGEICIKGHNVMKGYYKRPEATSEAIRAGWFHTGDIAVRDDDGYYFIVDRKKDMILRGGYNVYPREVEEVLYDHPAVAEVAVVGVPHRSHGEEVKAVVVLRGAGHATAKELIEYCRKRLAAYKYPRIVEFRESLPKGPTGKVLKRLLRE